MIQLTVCGKSVGGTSVLRRVCVRAAVGARDAIIGAGLAAHGTPAWLAASIAADTADGLDALFGDLPDERRSRVAGWAFGFATLGLVAGFVRRRG